MPEIIRNRVDLPQPEAPTIAKVWPCSKENEMPDKTFFLSSKPKVSLLHARNTSLLMMM